MNKVSSAKLKKSVPSSLASWHPYYAGYSENFVVDAINFLNVKKSETILDPWSGSGTTGHTSSRLGYRSKLIDINPVMSAYSGAKISYNPEENMISSLDLLKLSCEPSVSSEGSDFVADLIGKPASEYVRMVLDRIKFLESGVGDTNIKLVDLKKAFLISVVLRSIREVSGLERTKNPSWPSFKPKTILPEYLIQTIEKNFRSMLKDLSIYYGAKSSIGLQYVGDNKKMAELEFGDCEVFITSPPYLTRIDYAVSTKLEIHAIKTDVFDNIRRNIMGAPVIRTIDHGQIDSKRFGLLASRLLEDIYNHSSKASRTYYWKNIVQYFEDAYTAIDAMSNSLPKKSRGLIVVQNSYYKEISIDLSSILIEMFSIFGFKGSVVKRDYLSNTMSNVNSGSRIYSDRKFYSEDVLYLERK